MSQWRRWMEPQKIKKKKKNKRKRGTGSHERRRSLRQRAAAAAGVQMLHHDRGGQFTHGSLGWSDAGARTTAAELAPMTGRREVGFQRVWRERDEFRLAVALL